MSHLEVASHPIGQMGVVDLPPNPLGVVVATLEAGQMRVVEPLLSPLGVVSATSILAKFYFMEFFGNLVRP